MISLKHLYKNKVTLGLLCAAFFTLHSSLFTSCSDQFLEDKRPFGSFGPDEVYNDITSVKLRLNYLYQMSLPWTEGLGASNNNNNAPDLWPVGYPDILSNNTEEFGFTGYGRYCDPSKVVTYNENYDNFFYNGTNASPWKKMRECTDVIVRVGESTSLTEKIKRETEGQARFLRATRYFRLFKRFGGLPIITDIQSTLLRDTTILRAKRNSTRDTYRFIISDLRQAASELPARWEEDVNDWGRVTAGTALALAGYVANYFASPVFNPHDEASRWEEAYEINKHALDTLALGNFGLAYDGNPSGSKTAKDWARIWNTMHGGDALSSEAVYVVICNNIVDSYDRHIFNSWEQNIRPTTALGGNGRGNSLTPSAEMVDLFPMADGKRPTEAGAYTYNSKLFFLNRDPRFYRTFAFPGTEWRFVGDIDVTEHTVPYGSGTEYQLQNYAWYPSLEEFRDNTQEGYFTENLGNNGRSIYVRKKSLDPALSDHTYYNFTDENGFSRNGAPMIAMRYTEVLLNFAEAACGAKHLDEAWNALIQIRRRVGYEGDCGLDPAIRGDRAKMFEAILYERQIELAYEGKRFDDCHRWMLFDGGVNQASINPSWAPSGWGGNTCTYLGVKPLNNIATHRIEMSFDPTLYVGPKNDDSDPFVKTDSIKKPTALTLDEDFRTTTDPETGEVSYNNARVQQLAAFYSHYLVRKDIITKTTVNEESGDYMLPVWSYNCYLMGLSSGDQSNNPNVVQTMGWGRTGGGFGAFDPLSDNPVLDASASTPGNDAIMTE